MKINLPGVLRAMAKAEDRVEMVAEDPSVIDYCANAADTLDANDAEIAALRASVAALTGERDEAKARNLQSICVWCGTILPREPNDPAADLVTMFTHAEGCDKRPENRLAAELAQAESALAAERQEAARLADAIWPERGDDVGISDLVSLAEAQREDSRDVDEADSNVPGSYERARLARRQRATRLEAALDPDTSMSPAWKILAGLETARMFAATHPDGEIDYEAVFASAIVDVTRELAAARSALKGEGEASKEPMGLSENIIVTGKQRVWDKTRCERCHGPVWLWRHEIDDPDWDGSADDTRYTCRDCGGSGKTPVAPTPEG